MPSPNRTRARRPLRVAAILLLVGTGLACAGHGPPPRVVDGVDLDRYLGRWYEIASFPQRFQRGCVATRATYSKREDGRIRVVNECRDGSLDGELRSIEGVAWVSDPEQSQAKLEVQFFWPFRGDYWILALDPGYRHALVGNPDRDSLWILSRTPKLDEESLAALRADAAALGFDVDRLQRTLQSGAVPAPASGRGGA